MIFFHGEEQQGSQLGGWEWNGIKSPFKTDFEWFKNFKPVNSNDVLISTYPKAGTTWHQVCSVVISDGLLWASNFSKIHQCLGTDRLDFTQRQHEER